MFEPTLFLSGLAKVFSLSSLYALLIGSVIGVIIGALPGATATMAIAVLIPITFWFPPDVSLLMLMGVYSSGIFGGSISAILLNIPGTPASAATTFDGHPLALQGYGGKAAFLALLSSTIGGLISGIALLLAAPALAAIALRFGPPESMMVAIFGLVMVASLSSENLSKGLLMAAFGMFLGTIGVDPQGGSPRFTFGSINLLQGLSVVPVLIGVFSIPEVIRMMTSEGSHVQVGKQGKQHLSLQEIKGLVKTWGVSTAIGMVIGLIPAIGPETATFMCYDQAKRMAKDKSKFGHGALEGVAASEAGNNAVVGTSLAPMFALGIPGSGAAMALMGGLLIHGLRPGPQLFTEQKPLLMTLFLGFLLAQFFMLLVGYAAIKIAPSILKVRGALLGPIIIMVSMVGSYAINNNIFDVFTMLVAGVVAHFMADAGFSFVPVVLGMILGPMFEGELSRTLTISERDGFFVYLSHRPIALVILVLTIVTIIVPFIQMRKKQKMVAAQATVSSENEG